MTSREAIMKEKVVQLSALNVDWEGGGHTVGGMTHWEI